MRVLLLSTSMGMGGADKQLLSAAQAMRARGHQVLIVSLTALGPMGLEAENLGIPIASLQMRRGFPDPRGLFRLISLVRAWRPDVLHSHLVHANFMVRAMRPFVRVPAVISTMHSIHAGGPLQRAAYRLTNGLVDLTTIVSQAAADSVVAEGTVPRELLRVVPNGVDTDQFRELSSSVRQSLRQSIGLKSEFVWLAVGRFQAAKDYPNMLRGFAEVRARHPTTVLLLAGRGSLQSETESLARELGVADQVRFLGVRHDIPELMSAADAYVLSSAWEGMPVVLLEAAASGLPIVATSVGGNHEVVCDEETGFLVPARDPQALGVAMLRLMELPETQRRRMGGRGREHIRAQYALSRVVERWEALYREVLARKGLAPSDAPVPSDAALKGSRAG
jgi:glycosyltransferase involved in cell wall biosynthesis